MRIGLGVTIGLVAGSFSMAPASAVQNDIREGTLFDSADPLLLTITTDLQTVIRDIDSVEQREYPGRLSYTTTAGATVDLDIQLRTRGHFRRQRRNCNFPPLRVNLKKGQLAGTVFANQDKLKLVTHCQMGREDYEQNVLKEYLAYRVYNRLTVIGHRVRLAQITYLDTTDRMEPRTRYAFFIEHEDHLADRLEGNVLEQPVSAQTMNPDLMGIVDVFSYMVGNTDWSVPGLHNVLIIQTEHDLLPIPYDFDWTGLVNARYAEPDPNLHLRSVRDRLYRGTCREPEDFQYIFEWFIEQRDTIYAEIAAVPGLSERNTVDVTEYIDDFYETLTDPRAVRREFLERCS